MWHVPALAVLRLLPCWAFIIAACFAFFRIRHLLPVDVLKLGLSMLQVTVDYRLVQALR